MSRFMTAFCLAWFLVVGAAAGGRAEDEKKADKDTKVAEGTEFKLTPVEVTPAEKPDGQGLYEATLKAAKEPTKVKMPKESWSLGFYPKTVKGGGVGVAESIEGAGLKHMRPVAGKDDEEGTWQADPDDVITHVNGYAVNTVEELLCALSLAKNKNDVQIVIKDVTTGKPTIFYVTATKKKSDE
jgi:S1-C subfamily serine protease